MERNNLLYSESKTLVFFSLLSVESLGFSLQVMLSNECFEFNKIQHVKLTVS